MSRDTLTRLSEPCLVAISLRGANWPRGLITSTPIPDTWMGLIERRDGRRKLVPAGDVPRLDDEDSLLLVRNRPITVPLDVRDGVSSDGHGVDASCEILLRWAAREDELAALARSLVASESSGELTLDRLAARVADAGGRTALQTHLKNAEAAQLVQQDTRLAALEAIKSRLARFCFESGSAIEQVTKLSCTSRTLVAHESRRRQTDERMQKIKAREEVEKAALAATQRRLGELSGILEKMKGVASEREGLRWHDLLPSLAPAERGRLLENLWRVTPDTRKTTAICVVAGSECVWLDPQSPEKILLRVVLPGDFGGLRSVAFEPRHDCLLVGAATGVWALRAADGGVLQRFAVPNPVPSKTGFNAVTVARQQVVATHSQLGVWTWDYPDAAAMAPSDTTQGRCLLTPVGGIPRTIRCATALPDGRVLFAADDCVQTCDPARDEVASLAAVDDTIHALAIDGNDLYIGTADGKILMLAMNQPDDCWNVYRASGPVESLVVRRWNDLVELVAAAGSAGVLSIFAEQNVVSSMLESATSLRRAWASDDIVVGLNDRRDRLIVMNSSQAERSGREASLARILGNSIQDACLVTHSS